MAVTGSCHCGNISFTSTEDVTVALECNCSICRRKGALLHFAPPDAVTITHRDREATAYEFGARRITHRFCPICGIAPYAEVHPPGVAPVIAMNLRTTDLDLSTIPRQPYDGASD